MGHARVFLYFFKPRGGVSGIAVQLDIGAVQLLRLAYLIRMRDVKKSVAKGVYAELSKVHIKAAHTAFRVQDAFLARDKICI